MKPRHHPFTPPIRKGGAGDARAALNLRSPTPDDGIAVFDLIGRCPPLDPNSRYCNLLQCSHFADTSVIAMPENSSKALGFVSGYRIPGRQDTLFIWQVAVDSAARGTGLGLYMLKTLLERPALVACRYLETTIGPDNRASWRLFERLAEQLGATIETTTMFESERHFSGLHPDEILLRIGPFEQAAG